MKKRIVYTAGLLLIFMVSVIVHLPANLALKVIPTPPALQLFDVRGTLWQGEIRSVLWQNHELGPLIWRVRPFAMLAGKLSADVDLGTSRDSMLHGQGEAGIGFSGIYLHDFLLTAPAQMVADTVRFPMPVSVGGVLKLIIQDYQYHPPFCARGNGNLLWSNAQISLFSQSLSLEKVSAQLACEDSQIQLEGQQLSDMVQSQYTVSLTAKEQYQFQGWVKLGERFPSQFGQWIRDNASADNQGRYAFQSKGQLAN